jgi:hypothetical protein
MSVPDYSHIVRQRAALFGPLDSHERCGEFVEYVAPFLHAHDANFGHLKKHPGQTQYNGHAADAVLYKATGQAVDIIGASKIASPQNPGTPAWGVDIPRYTAADWINPSSLPSGDEEDDALPPPPPKKDEPPHVCPVFAPKHSYADTLSLANDLDSAYRAETGRTVHPEPLAHWIWRYLVEGYSRDSLIAQAVARGIEEA